MGKTSGVVTLNYVVANLKNRLKSYGMTDHLYLLQLVIDAYTKLNLITLDHVETVYLDMDERNVVVLPDDYLDYVKIGVSLCGRIWTLTLNENIVTPKGEACGLPIDKVAAGCCDRFPNEFPLPAFGYVWAPFYWNGTYYPELYSWGGGFNTGYYKIDRQERLLIITGVPRTQIVMEYKSTGIKPGGGTLIPRQAVDCLVYYVMWQQTEFGLIAGNPQRWKDLYEEEDTLLMNLEYSHTADEYLDAFYSSWRQGPKR